MDNPNPYESPSVASDSKLEDPAAKDRIDYRGGWIFVLAIGLIGGGATAVVFLFPNLLSGLFINPLLFIGVVWFVALFVVVSRLGGTNATTGGNLTRALIATPFAYFLYVTTCSATAFSRGDWLHGGGETFLAVSSTICFLLVMLLLAYLIRQRSRSRMKFQDSAGESEFIDDSASEQNK